MNRDLRVIIMGVCGCGKSTIGGLLADRVHGHFLDGDDLHPASNVEKMASGTPLTDQDRQPWLRAIGDRLGGSSGITVIACSALKRAYRDMIREPAPDTVFIHLHGTRTLLEQRMAARPGHFMPTSLLNSQLATLEHLETDEQGAMIDVSDPPKVIIDAIANYLSGTEPHLMVDRRTTR